MDDLLTPLQAARETGLDPSWLQRLCRNGRLPGAVHSNPDNPRRGEWRFPRASLTAYLATRRKRGRPKRLTAAGE